MPSCESVFSNSVFLSLLLGEKRLVNSIHCRSEYISPLFLCVCTISPAFLQSLLKNRCFAPHIRIKILSWYTHQSPCIGTASSQGQLYTFSELPLRPPEYALRGMSSARMALVYTSLSSAFSEAFLVFHNPVKTFKTACIPLFPETMP